jgi:CHAT domain-containing protein
VLTWKGIVLDSVIADRARLKNSKNTADKSALEKITSLRRQLAQILIMNTDRADEEIQTLKDKIFSAERAVFKNSATLRNNKSQPASCNNVKGSLSEDSALVEFVSYRELPDIRNGKLCYGALVTLKSSDPMWIPISSAEDGEKVFHVLQDHILKQDSDESGIRTALRSTYDLLFAQVEKVLPHSVSKLYLSPDGILNFIPFSCLLRPDSSFLGEKFSVSYVGSGRDLLRESRGSQRNMDLQIIANPKFDQTQDRFIVSQGDFVTRLLDTSDFSQLKLPSLPGTENEAHLLAENARSVGWMAQIHTGKDATEKVVYEMKAPQILHLATHGFFLGGSPKSINQVGSNRGMAIKPTTPIPQKNHKNLELSPMFQSGVALAFLPYCLVLDLQIPCP